ncbi:d-glutamate cyclase [Anaeramoeba flamelloides]|uniref:D-glutamate cyclase n=1 Tax=Anaeramoeba flamelloides TaxID=1746091 RepID=A0AAV7ZY12_9EUKA|nr:d-glutamate cyclase [Anaeramoeba flamelloides]
MSIKTNNEPNKYEQIRQIVQRDLGSRGITRMFDRESTILESMSKNILNSKLGVCIVTGFYIPSAGIGETDGPHGTIFLAKAIHLLRPSLPIHILTDGSSSESLKRGLRHSNLSDVVKLHVPENEEQFSELENTLAGGIDRLVSIERCGHNKNGEYRSMSSKNITQNTLPFDRLFGEWSKNNNVMTMAIGDGGNEIGMGKFYDIIVTDINFGEVIACTVETDLVMCVGVSNWGGYAIAAAMMIDEQIQNNTRLMENIDWFRSENQSVILDEIIKGGCVDGISGKIERKVDGLDFDSVHAEMIDLIMDIVIL